MVIEKMSIPEIIFWFSLSLLAIVYVSYYSLCLYVVKIKKLKVKKNIKFRPKVSFVIATWNEEKTISGKLKNTLALDYPKDKLEVIVIDSGSTDQTKNIVRKFKKVRLIVEKERKGKADALNKAFKECKGDIVVISDSDCRLDKDILKKSMPYFFDPKVGALTGRQILLNSKENLATKTEQNYRNFYFIIRNAESIIDSTLVFHGEFSAFRKELLDNIYNDSVADDSELALRIRKKNYRALMIWDAVYREYAPNRLSDRIKQKYRRAQGLVQIMSRFFSTFFLNPNYGYFGMLIFPVEFFMHTISPFIVILTLIAMFFLPLNLLILIFLGIIGALSIGTIRSFMLTFMHSQYACLKGMVSYLFKGSSFNWEKVHGTRRYNDE
jgi:cellulose synthase/poly-beta-1,6-N-acetylglucosamine synthase-like glycosyltransferase